MTRAGVRASILAAEDIATLDGRLATLEPVARIAALPIEDWTGSPASA